MKIFLIGVVLLLASSPAFAQGCSTCTNSAASAPERSQRALRRGIIIMMVPSLAIMAGFAGIAYRYRR
ncbi:MAG TPA: hypothetical protein VMZ25_05230 [Terriglobales bacterium]|nr:hypothetical protein [Terriglobales bacterium]